MRGLIGLQACFFVLAAGFVAHAQSEKPTDVPAACILDCKKQYRLLDTFHESTQEAEIKKAFGEPAQRAKGKKYEIVKYKGAVVDLFILRFAGKREALGIAIHVIGDASHARLPFVHMGEGEPTKWYLTARDMDLRYLTKSCEGIADLLDSGNNHFWTPKCYFGRPGNYKVFSFLFYGADFESCVGKRKAIEMDGLDCPQAGKITPKGMFVSIAGDERPDKVASAITLFIFRNEVE